MGNMRESHKTFMMLRLMKGENGAQSYRAKRKKQRLIKGNKIELRVMEPIEKQLCGKKFITYIQVFKEYK